MFTVELFQTATADVQESYDWYEEQSIGSGNRFVNEVDDYLNLISENPFQFAVHF